MVGVGRSGTSLTTELLSNIGLRLSSDLVGASDDNPRGHFEDGQIVSLQGRLLRDSQMLPFLPRPDTWREGASLADIKNQLTSHVHEEVNAGDSMWGFKDPRTTLTWPLWQEVLTELSIRPLIVYCTRPSGHVVSSLVKAYGLGADEAEALILYRAYHSLRDMEAEDIFFVRYDDWWDDPRPTLDELGAFCGLDPSDDEIAKALGVLEPRLARSQPAGSGQMSPLVEALDEVFSVSRGNRYDRELIAEWCRHVGDTIEALGVSLRPARRQLEARDNPSFRVGRVLRAVWPGRS